MTDQIQEQDISVAKTENEEISDWRLKYVIEYFLPDNAKWGLVKENKINVTIPLEHEQGGKTQPHLEIAGDNLVRIPKDLSEQTGPHIEYQSTNSEEKTNEGGLVLLLNTFSLALPGEQPQSIKDYKQENKRLQDLKFIFWPGSHISYTDSSVYYPKLNVLNTPFTGDSGALNPVTNPIGTGTINPDITIP